MKVQLVAVGKVKGSVSAAVSEYEKRAARYWKLDVTEVSAGASGSSDPDRVRAAEGERLLGRLADDLEVVALTRTGRGMRSKELAAYLERHAVRSSPGVAFVIGGAFGLSDELLGRARRKLALSSFTLPHDMARLVMLEQIYRAGTIRRGEPYHKA